MPQTDAVPGGASRSPALNARLPMLLPPRKALLAKTAEVDSRYYVVISGYGKQLISFCWNIHDVVQSLTGIILQLHINRSVMIVKVITIIQSLITEISVPKIGG